MAKMADSWYRVMLVFPVEVLASSKQDALDMAMEALLEEANESGLDSLHDLLASDYEDVYEVDTPTYDPIER